MSQLVPTLYLREARTNEVRVLECWGFKRGGEFQCYNHRFRLGTFRQLIAVLLNNGTA
jgi:hypothetical protein